MAHPGQDTSYIFTRLGVYDGETNAFGNPQHQIRNSYVAKRLSIIQPVAGISFDEFGNERMIWATDCSVTRKCKEVPVVGPTDYDGIARRYAAKIDERPWNALYERPATLDLLPDVNGKDVLDAGCGHGWYADQLARKGARIVAVDRSRDMVTLARERLRGRARVIHGDVSDLRDTLASDSFDVVLSSLVVHYLSDLSKTFLEWARLLRPRGILGFSTHHPLHEKRISDPGYLCAEVIEEEWDWLGEKMRYYQRPLRDLTEPLSAAKFLIERISEPTPSEAFKSYDPRGYEQLSRVPAFIFIRARKGE